MTTSALNAPFFAWDNGDLLVFDSLDRMFAYIEWQDVQDGVYQVFDGVGRRLEVGVSALPATQGDERRIQVVSVDDDPVQASRLVEILRRALHSIHHGVATDDLKVLVAEARRAFEEDYT